MTHKVAITKAIAHTLGVFHTCVCLALSHALSRALSHSRSLALVLLRVVAGTRSSLSHLMCACIYVLIWIWVFIFFSSFNDDQDVYATTYRFLLHQVQGILHNHEIYMIVALS